MAKKKSIKKTIAFAGTGLTIIVIAGLVAVFGFGIGYDFVVPQDAEGLEIPVITPSETQQIQEIIDRISEISNSDLVDAQFCIEFIDDPEILAICNQLLQDALDRIEVLDMEIEEILPSPDLNNTDTSKDPPPVQICDSIDGGCVEIRLILPELGTKTVVLSSLITKIDTQGNKTFAGGFSRIPALSFFVEDVSNIDFSKGFLEIQTKATFRANESPNPKIIGTADFDILINGQSILTDQITFEVDGGHCTIECAVPAIFCFDDACSFNFQEGVGAEFVSSTGLRSRTFTFSFEENFDKFPNGISTLEFVLINSDFTVDSDQNFQATNVVLFSMDIAKDPNQIIIDDETGGTERVFPIDSVLKVTGATTPVKAIRCSLYFVSVINCPNCRVGQTSGDPRALVSPDSCTIGTITEITFATDTARVFGLNLFDDSGNFLQSFAGGQGEVLNELLPRNTNYTLTIASPTLSTDLSFPKAQQTQSYTCTNEYSITYEKVIVEAINAVSSAGGYVRHTLEPVSFSVTDVICNFPE